MIMTNMNICRVLMASRSLAAYNAVMGFPFVT
jgi:hypothetical protein